MLFLEVLAYSPRLKSGGQYCKGKRSSRCGFASLWLYPDRKEVWRRLRQSASAWVRESCDCGPALPDLPVRWFCPTWTTLRYLITLQTRVKCVNRIHQDTGDDTGECFPSLTHIDFRDREAIRGQYGSSPTNVTKPVFPRLTSWCLRKHWNPQKLDERFSIFQIHNNYVLAAESPFFGLDGHEFSCYHPEMTRLNTQGRVHSVKRAHLSLLGHHSSYVSPLAQNPRQTLSFYKLENGKIFIFHSSSAVKNWRSLVSSDSIWNKGQRRFFIVYARLTCHLWPGLKSSLLQGQDYLQENNDGGKLKSFSCQYSSQRKQVIWCRMCYLHGCVANSTVKPR